MHRTCDSIRRMSRTLPATADRIRATGARATPARVHILDLLQNADRALSHADIEQQLGRAHLDRVTIYRVLDWLVSSGLAHRVADESRVFRFSLADETRSMHRTHAHFRCDSCSRVFCLDDVHPPQPRLPRGFVTDCVDLSIRGKCAECAHHR
jgi:Fur family ferric uptake transcriptional regulator